MDILGLKYKQFSGGGVKKYFFQTRKKHEFFIFELCMIQKWIKVMDSILIFCRLPKYSELRCAQTFCFFMPSLICEIHVNISTHRQERVKTQTFNITSCLHLKIGTLVCLISSPLLRIVYSPF